MQNNNKTTTSNQITDTQLNSDSIISWIKSRRSIGNLDLPAPAPKQIKEAIQCAMTAPDHKKLQPWRFIVMQGQALQELGEVFVTAALARAEREDEVLDEATLNKTRKMPLRAPLIITVATHMHYHEKVPEFEQLLSAGAAVQNLILALKAQGYDTVWRTGLLANEDEVKSYFKVAADDYIVGFVYIGSSACEMPERDDIDTSDFIEFK